MARVGITSGVNVFVHSAWDEFYNFDGQPLDLIRILQDQIGPDGTLVMPAYPMRTVPSELFDVRRTPTGAGLVAELFRRMRGAHRSINLYQSVAAVGPQAAYLVSDHHRSVTPWDRHSPFPRLAEINAVILCIGLPPSFGLGTVLHCPESLLYGEIPYFERVFGEPQTYRYRDNGGEEGTHAIRPRIGRWKPNRVRRHIDEGEVHITHVSNVRIQAISASYLVKRMVGLARQGIVNYYWPLPRRRLFEPRGNTSEMR